MCRRLSTFRARQTYSRARWRASTATAPCRVSPSLQRRTLRLGRSWDTDATQRPSHSGRRHRQECAAFVEPSSVWGGAEPRAGAATAIRASRATGRVARGNNYNYRIDEATRGTLTFVLHLVASCTVYISTSPSMKN